MTVLDTRIDGPVLSVGLARAERGNALNRSLQRELARTWASFESDDSLRIAVLHGTASVFSIGHDVAELAADPSAGPIPDEHLFPLHLSKPVIAAIDGPCYGLGFELALACDLRVASEGAQFGFVDPHLFVPFRVATVLLPRMTFLGTSLDLIFSGHRISATEMRELGLVSELVAGPGAAPRAIELAHDMSRRFSGGCDCRKQAIWRLSGMALPTAMQMARTVR